MKILIITPMQEEFNFFLQSCTKHGYQTENSVAGRLPAVRLPGLGITLANGGIGKTQFAVQTQHLLDNTADRDLVICAGAAGGLIDDLSIGDVVVATRTGKVVLLQLTSMGKRLMRNKGYQILQSNRQESIVHEYWKHKAAKYYESLGYKVEIKKKVNGHTDLVMEKNSKRFAVEIETGKSNWRVNMQRNLEHCFQNIIIIATNNKIYFKLKKLKEQEQLDPQVEIFRAQDFL